MVSRSADFRASSCLSFSSSNSICLWNLALSVDSSTSNNLDDNTRSAGKAIPTAINTVTVTVDVSTLSNTPSNFDKSIEDSDSLKNIKGISTTGASAVYTTKIFLRLFLNSNSFLALRRNFNSSSAFAYCLTSGSFNAYDRFSDHAFISLSILSPSNADTVLMIANVNTFPFSTSRASFLLAYARTTSAFHGIGGKYCAIDKNSLNFSTNSGSILFSNIHVLV